MSRFSEMYTTIRLDQQRRARLWKTFCALNGGLRETRYFALHTLKEQKQHTVKPSTGEYGYWSFPFADHRSFFKLNGKAQMIVTEPYMHRTTVHENLAELRDFLFFQGLKLTTPVLDPYDSIWNPQKTTFCVITRPETEVKFLPASSAESAFGGLG